MTLTDMHVKALREFEGKKLCSISQAMNFLDIRSRTKFDEILNAQLIESKYLSAGSRKVVVESLLAYYDGLPIDRPEVR